MSRAEQPGPCFWFGVLLFACAVLATAPARAVDRQDQKTLPPPSVASSPLDPWTQLGDIENARAALANAQGRYHLSVPAGTATVKAPSPSGAGAACGFAVAGGLCFLGAALAARPGGGKPDAAPGAAPHGRGM